MDRRRLKKNSRTMDVKEWEETDSDEENDIIGKESAVKEKTIVQRCKTTTSMPPVDTPNWCLTDEALKRFNRSTNEIPTYDYNTDQDEESYSYQLAFIRID
ncbi:hypothetical protein RhiirC2_798367 [Rhizophagus irregularis]|uniref:Uncharacterized protein n=1 Tax=Rhizophagus irregularis TaxID=588596 RepID=A0A2N1M6L1_9GLOM|nr:hypothetical protein RhiirC2_798367 [Rhizophagus irregularis]